MLQILDHELMEGDEMGSIQAAVFKLFVIVKCHPGICSKPSFCINKIFDLRFGKRFLNGRHLMSGQ
ncbi:hypothetical protein D3C81_2281930 [compost metagenome]